MIKGYPGSLYGSYRTKTFADTWQSANEFLEDYHSIGIPAIVDDGYVSTLYYLLYSRYANSHIASSDPTRFRYNVFSIVWQFGPNWTKKLEIQEKLRELTDDQLLEGSRQIYNNASNPSNDPSNFTDNELQFINNQNVTKNRKGKLEGYALLVQLLEDDVTEKFLSKFKKLFKEIVMPELPLVYLSEKEEDEEDE